MTHRDEICYWAEHPDKTKVWFKQRNKKWILTSYPAWLENAKYIVKNKWAKLRMAQADGKQLQYHLENGKWIDAKISKFDFVNGNTEPKDWRIKQEESAYEYQWVIKSESSNGYWMSYDWHTEEEARSRFKGKMIEPYLPSKRIRNE